MIRNYLVSGSVTAEQLTQLMYQIAEGAITGKHLSAFLQHKNPFEPTQLDDGLPIEQQLARWSEFLQELFEIEIDPNRWGVRVPPSQFEATRIIVVPQGLRLHQVIEACLERFKLVAGDEPEDLIGHAPYDYSSREAITLDARRADSTYVVWVKGAAEISASSKGLSANDARAGNVAGMTLIERLLYELKYFRETGRHLDEAGKTLCTGSIFKATGLIPVVYMLPEHGGLCISETSPDESNSDTGVRPVYL